MCFCLNFNMCVCLNLKICVCLNAETVIHISGVRSGWQGSKPQSRDSLWITHCSKHNNAPVAWTLSAINYNNVNKSLWTLGTMCSRVHYEYWRKDNVHIGQYSIARVLVCACNSAAPCIMYVGLCATVSVCALLNDLVLKNMSHRAQEYAHGFVWHSASCIM